MPLVFQQDINENAKIGVWCITEPESFFLEQVNASQNINNPMKRWQHLAGRLLLKTINPSFPLDAICIEENGRPFLKGNPLHFSISHTAEYVAAIICSSHPVGVDIEKIDSKIQRVKHKFIDFEEMAILNELPLNDDEQNTLAWCVKEAVFKWHQRGGVDFIKHIRICETQKNLDGIKVYCDFLKGERVSIVVRALRYEDCMLAWVE
jgi:phosphopantetheinyl transferase